MAPRGRSRKPPIKGQTRMDAALDAMKSYGFAEKLIFSTVKELLDVYGVDGWPFIEEACYKVLLENILEKVESEVSEKGNDSGGDATKASAPEPSSSVSVPTCSNEEANMDISLQSNIALDNASPYLTVQVGAEPTDGSEHVADLPHAENSSWKDLNVDQGSRKKEITSAEVTNARKSHAVEKLGVTCPPLRPQEQEHTCSTRRHKPCYGWISGSDDELDLVELTPAPLPDKLANLLPVATIPRIRKRRWDVRPGDT